jgi:predicted O-linked N-acetylglucosamine transferase (SPINDLY family)
LDSYPYSGATTTLDSLWMGVPVLTLAGDPPISRSTASILATLGMNDWIARTPDEFVAFAARLASDPGALAALRAGLRTNLETSILMDGARFTAQLEDLYRQMWHERGIANG